MGHHLPPQPPPARNGELVLLAVGKPDPLDEGRFPECAWNHLAMQHHLGLPALLAPGSTGGVIRGPRFRHLEHEIDEVISHEFVAIDLTQQVLDEWQHLLDQIIDRDAVRSGIVRLDAHGPALLYSSFNSPPERSAT